jgi:hypothetical protein
MPKAAATPATTLPAQLSPPVGTLDLSVSLHDLMKSIRELSTKQDAPQTLQQQQRGILQAVKAQVIDHYRTPLGLVTVSMRGAAKLAIEQKLAPLPLAEVPFEEVCEFAAAIRDPLYAIAFKRQAREADRRHVEAETRQKKEVEALGALLRADRRKKTFIQQAIHQAHASCQEKEITGWAHLSVVGDIESRLEVFLTWDEPIIEAQTIVRSVLDDCFAEAEATLAAARAKADEQWREEVAAVLVLGVVVGLVMLSLKYPAQTLTFFNWIERTFGLTPGAEAAPQTRDAAETSPPASSAEARPRSTHRRKDPIASPSPESLWAPSVDPAQGHA